ncbi:hypothetical protein BDFB_004401 [Asbolus verrucosus]|uniref:Uncharacterized protein n=1 Tax=Asbolus verrucosus TaxID=1661398 RepID=A0A482VSU6_ASBVE|nr:hypothetical protein BDFB_004401 [Asbolus verrucosus]
MKYRILIAFLFVLHGVPLSGSLSTQKPNVTLISSTVATTLSNSTQSDTESKANPVGNSSVTSVVPPTTTTSANFNALNTTTEITETRPQYPSLHRALTPSEEKLEALSCDLPLLPNDYRIWKGNETHELLLPIAVSTLKELYCPHVATTNYSNFYNHN